MWALPPYFLSFCITTITNRITVATPGPESPCLRILFPEQGGRVLVRIFRWSGGRAHVSGGGAFPRRPRAGCPGRIPAGIWRMGSSSVHTAGKTARSAPAAGPAQNFSEFADGTGDIQPPGNTPQGAHKPVLTCRQCQARGRRIVAGSSRKASAPHCPRRVRSLANRRRKPRPMRRNSLR